MNITTYAEKARSTAIYNGPYTYPTHGVAGEVGELIDKLTATEAFVHKDEIIKEMGDVLWYLVSTAADAGLNFSDIVSSISNGLRADNFTEVGAQMKQSNDRRSALMKMPIYAGRVNEIAKKMIRDSGGQFPTEKRTAVAESLSELLVCLFEIGCAWSINLDDVAQANIDKLFSRKERGVLKGSGDNR